MRSSFSLSLLYHAYVYLEFLILACTIYILAPMWVILYWEGGLLFMDRGGNMVSKIPSNALSQVKFKGRKIIIPYNGKRYVIVRCKNDNEKDVQEMLQFYHLV